MRAVTPPSSLGSKRREAAPPYCAASRSRVFASPIPKPGEAPASPAAPRPGPSSATSTSRPSAQVRARTTSSTGPVRRSIPCLTAFSRSGWSSRLGTRALAASAATWKRQDSLSPNRVRSTSR